MTDDLILTFDGGTQSIRCAIINLTGKTVDSVRTPIQPYFSEQPGYAEQHPDYYWEKFCETGRTLISRNANCMDRVKVVSITAQRGTYLNLDKDGKALRPAILWLDKRMLPNTRWAPFHMEAAFRAVGVFHTLDRYYRQAWSNWIKECQPGIWEKTHKYLLLTAFFHFKLTGNYIESLGGNYGYLPTDRRTFGWAKKNDLVNLLFPIERQKLPDLVKQGQVIGAISHQASLDTGIPEGLPLVAAAGDKMCEVLGDGVISSDIACLSLGTCATIDTVTDHYVEILPYFTPYPAAIPGCYMPEITINRGFWMVSWFLEQFGLKEQQLSQEKNVPAEALLEELIKDIPPGSQGLMLQPLWFPNAPFAGEEGKGAVIGFSEGHTRAHFYRAILEGVMYALRQGGEIMTAKFKKPFKRLRVSGGGAKSNAALQIAADVFGLPVDHLAAPESGMLGAAINAAVGMGYYPDYPAAVQGMVHVDRTVQPDPGNRKIYNQLYERIYLRMYSRLEPLYKEIWDIASYNPGKLPSHADGSNATG